MDHNNSQRQNETTSPFAGFEPLSANYLYCPNQFFDLCIRNCSRGTVRIVAYLLRQTLGWLDREGNPISQTIRVTYSDLIEKAGVSRGAISKAMSDAVAAGFIECCNIAAPSRKGQTAASASYVLRWSDNPDYTKSLDSFDGFYAGEGHRTPIPNSFFDHVVSNESLAVVKVVGTVLRHTVGYQTQFGGRRTSAPLSYSYIQQYSGLNSRSVLSDAMKAALNKAYIHCTQTGRFHANEAQRKAARYAVKWRVCDSGEGTGSKTEPVDRAKIRTSTGSKTEPANQFNNRTKEKTFSKHTDKQTHAAVEDEMALNKMLAERIDRKTAIALLKKRGAVVVANQIAWLDARNPTENRVGMLRKAIDEDWEKPAAIEFHERQLKQRERDRKQDTASRQEDATIAETKLQRKHRKNALLKEWSNASTEERRRWIRIAAEQESSVMIAEIIRRDSAKVMKPHRQVLDAIAADRKLPPVILT